jgi:hypothetical protein
MSATPKAFTDRPLTNADQAWWKLWREAKEDLKKAGFSVAMCECGCESKCDCPPWLLTFEPTKNAPPPRDDPELERKRDAARRVHEKAKAAAEAAIRAERSARVRFRKMYTVNEWYAPLVDQAFAALGEPEPQAPAAEKSAKILQFRSPVLQPGEREFR